MQILLNSQHIAIEENQLQQPLLTWLREQQNLNASKEGCGAGDCGACTLLVGRLQSSELGQSGAMHYQAVNACIALVGSVVNAHVVTLEGVSLETQLHPVQQALVDFHGSQCGFCTPGIVMAMMAWWLNTPANAMQSDADVALHEHNIEQALSGNLCRCTGYHPILQAAASLAPFTVGTQASLVLAGLTQATIEEFLTANQQSSDQPSYQQPHNEQQLTLAIDAAPQAVLISGGTDLGLQVTQQLKTESAYIDLSQVSELQNIATTDEYLCIGGGATFSQLEDFVSGQMSTENPMAQALNKLLPLIGSRQVRNRGTLGGNIANASPIADTPPLLLALQSELVLSKQGQLRDVALADFYTGYRQSVLQQGEYIREIRIPLTQVQVQIEKISKRHEDDISAACIALSFSLNKGVFSHCCIGLGGMAATPSQASTLQINLIGMRPTEVNAQWLLEQLEQDVTPMSDVRASAKYRLQVCANVLAYWLQDAESIVKGEVA